MKWDHITKEELYDLYIVKNLSKTEIRGILGIPETSLKRLLVKFNIVKSEELFKSMQSRVNTHTEKSKQLVSIAMKKRWESYSDEQKEKTIQILKKVNNNRTKEHKQKLLESNKRFYLNETPEARQQRIELIRLKTTEAMRNMSDDKKLMMYSKRTQAIKNRTPEQKRLSLKKLRETWYKKSQEEKLDIYTKSIQTRLKNGNLQKSKGEEEIKLFIESLGFKTSRLVRGLGENRFELDIFIEELNVAVEYNGVYYHSVNGCNKRTKSYHYNKSMICNDLGISLIHIWEDQWLNQKELVQTILKSRLGILNENRIYARKCIVKEIDVLEYKTFCENNHIQGYRSASVRLGLFYNNELIQIASFNKVRNLGKQNRNEEWEWVRGCSIASSSVIGGTSKLFNYFINIYKPTSVLCYSDWNLFEGFGYIQCGFKFEAYTGPDLFYVTNSTCKRRSRNPYKHKEYEKLVESKKLFKCYGAGSKRFIWLKP